MIRITMDPRRFAPALLAVFAAGCSLFSAPTVTPTRYYVLASDRGLGVGGSALTEASLGVGPFTFPSYLARPQMASRRQPNQIVFSRYNRWAEPVKSGFQRVLAENIGRVVGTSQVVLFPWYQIPLEYQVKGEVLRFETNEDGEVVLECIWTIMRLAQRDYLVTRHADLRRGVNPDDPDEVTAALSQLVSDLGRQIGEALRAETAIRRR